MSNHSIIEHRANYHFLKVEEDFLAICSSGKESPHCKALILAILEHWTNTKRDQDQGDYIYMSMPQWIMATYQLYERNILTDCLRELVEEGMIERRPIIMYAQKTFDYRLCIDVVQERIRDLPSKESVLPQLNAFAAFKERQKAERAEKREEVGEKSPTLETASDKSLEVGEKSPTVGDKPRRVRDKSRKVGDKSTQHRLTKTLSTSVSLSPSQNAQDDAVEISEEIPILAVSPLAAPATRLKPSRSVELSPEQKTRARAIKAKIEDRCGKLASAGPNIAENKAIARLVQKYSDADIYDVEHYLIHCHFKWSKPDFKFKIRGNVIQDEMEPTLKLFAENPKLRDATSAPTTNFKPAQQEGMKYKRLPPVPTMIRQVAGVR